MTRENQSATDPIIRTFDQDDGTHTNEADIARQVEAVCTKTQKPCPRVVLDDRAAQPIETINGGVAVSSHFAANARSPVERIALAALLIAWRDDDGKERSTLNSDLGKQLAAIGVLGVGEAIDQLHDRTEQIRRAHTHCVLGTATTPMVCYTTRSYGGPPNGRGNGTGQGTQTTTSGSNPY